MCPSTFAAGRSEGHFPNASSIQIGIASAATMTGVVDTAAAGVGWLGIVVVVVIVAVSIFTGEIVIAIFVVML